MALISCKYHEKYKRSATFSDRNGTYPDVTYRVVADQGHCGGSIILMAQDPLFLPPGSDQVPEEGDHYNHHDLEDAGSFASSITCELEEEGIDHDIYQIQVSYEAPKGNSRKDKQRKTQPNPIDWSADYWVEWEEIQVPVEKASCLTDLPTILRGPSFEDLVNDIPPRGPVVNAAGQQTIDPLMTTVHQPILCSEKNYPYAFVANLLNDYFSQSFNSEDFLGCPTGFWKYLISAAARVQEKEVPGVGTVKYVPVTTKIKAAIGKEVDGTFVFNWDHYILNNGQSCFRRKYKAGEGSPLIYDPRYPDADPKVPMLFPTTVNQLRDDFDEGTLGTPTADPELADFETVYSSEPMNLRDDGTQIGSLRSDGGDPEPGTEGEVPIHIRYRDLNPLDYNDMNYNDGILFFDGPFKELVEEYEALYG